jgi:dihydroorotase
MTQPLLVKNARILDPGRKIDYIGNLFIDEKGIICRCERDSNIQTNTGYLVIEADGLIVCPGFIDLHCHLRQPGYETKETIATGTMAAAKGGFTSVCCMPNTNPPLDNSDTIRFINNISEKEGVVRVIPIACVSMERKGRAIAPLSELASQDIAGFSDDGSPVFDPEIMRKALMLCRENGLPIIEHCEDTGLAGDGVINEGKISKQLSLKGIPAAAEENMVARDIRLARETGGWVHIAHASTAGSVELIRQAKAEGLRVTAEVTPHHLALTEEEVIFHGTQAKVNPPLRTAKDIDALILGLIDGTIDIIATDHAPHTEADKNCSMSQAAFGISGFETAFGSLMGLVHSGRISMELLIDKLTRQPALILRGRQGIFGTLAERFLADVVLIDPEKEWKVNSKDFVSKGKNTPLDNVTLKGKVVATISRGKMVYRDESLK